jgi:hypothetical protein
MDSRNRPTTVSREILGSHVAIFSLESNLSSEAVPTPQAPLANKPYIPHLEVSQHGFSS